MAKHAGHPYRPGVRGWQKLRARLTAEAVVGGVLGPPAAPTVLILGRPDQHGFLQVAGRSKDLTPAAAATIGATLRGQVVLSGQVGVGHPWPEVLPRSRWGGRPAEPLAYTRVRPEVVVELVVDPAVDGPRWRHPATFVRLRPDLRPGDLKPIPPSTERPHGLEAGTAEPAAGRGRTQVS